MRISPHAKRMLRETRPDVVVHTTGSFLADVEEQLLLCADAGAHVVSSSEELCYPFERDADAAERIHAAAKARSVAILATGVNPGYAMDTLALAATGVCTRVRRLQIKRVVDASLRREPLQRKIGAGLTAAQFDARQRKGGFGHIGLRESLLVVAAGLDWQLDEIQEKLGPVLAERAVTTPYLHVEEGHVAGIAQSVVGRMDGETVLSLELRMYAGAAQPTDSIRVTGDPPIHLEVHGGIFGDTATVGALVNAIPLVIRAAPGLQTVKDLPVPRAFAGRLH